MSKPDSFFEAVYAAVRQIPRGRVATYGQIARLLNNPAGSRAVGWALRALPRGHAVPWQRVVNARGEISLSERHQALQKAFLESEGVRFDKSGRISLDRYQWRPEDD
jgi:methylated-DNA-protein-cysteine methyltransferase-like protein